MTGPGRLLNRRGFLVATGGLALAGCAEAAEARTVTVYKTPTCGCCGAWAEHMREAGFETTIVNQDDLTAVRRRLGVPDAVVSCHTGVIGDYFFEGHVPAEDVRRLLRERPAARGLAVPGMPIGSPGMEVPDGTRESYQVLIVARSGAVSAFATHG
jgi:hypothetical protein